MNDNPEIPRRRSLRLQDYDYSQAGAYFVTICTQDARCLFGKIADGEMLLNEAGRVVEMCWKEIPKHFPQVQLDEFVIMPNHVHGILFIGDTLIERAKNFSPLPDPKFFRRPAGTSKTLGSVVRGFKIGVTRWLRQNTTIHDVWQRNYWEHIIRHDSELTGIRE
ncbi:MAG TPA: hypothetical protein DDY32_03095 [Desulfobulbaceae bacterium]|nr:hypothetical protein [Desulfobulbaceae bacterium]